MYTKQEIAKAKQAFWTAFGRYMKPIQSADGEPISWLNYKTGIKYIQFKMDADTKHAGISITLTHPDPATRQVYFDRLKTQKPILDETLRESDWTWTQETPDEHGKPVSLIQKQLPDVNVFHPEDWPTIISFLKPRIIALDEFWSLAKYQFNQLPQ
jgi:hypothetical protein